jgi:hypothetical protein
MAKVTKIVSISLMTRVIVDENATEEQIVEIAKKSFQKKLDNNELLENLDSISKDKEMPFGTLDTDVEEIYVLGENSINGIQLNEKIRDEELHEYYIVDRKEFINDLINWISEANGNNKILMKDDLEMLMDWEDEYILSSNSTNSYINSEDSCFNVVCQELLDLNKELGN